jgi:alcohol dehydrogenase class IV
MFAVREHTPAPVVIDGAQAAGSAGADCLVSLGGSSVVDLTKGIACCSAKGALADHDCGRVAAPALRAVKLPHIAATDDVVGSGVLRGGRHNGSHRGREADVLRPPVARLVVFDSVLAATPGAVWAGTGMKVVADTIEVLCARRANPQTDALALGALRLLVDNLGPATTDLADNPSRGRCQFAVAMVFPQLAAVGVGLVAALRHQLGGGLGIPHGEASTIVLPHVMRYNQSVAADHYNRAAATLGLSTPDELISRIEELTAALGLPGRLRDTGIARADLDGTVVDHVLADGGSRGNIATVDAAGVRQILDAAW